MASISVLPIETHPGPVSLEVCFRSTCLKLHEPTSVFHRAGLRS